MISITTELTTGAMGQ